MACSVDVPQTQFLGATVQSFSCSLGWNEQPTTLSITLVEDSCVDTRQIYDPASPVPFQNIVASDNFNPPPVGSPVYFGYGNFTFAGLLSNWAVQEPNADPPTYTVTVVSPVELLQGVQLILSQYAGEVGGPNIFNVYGYLEATYGNACTTLTFDPIDGPIFGSVAGGFGGANSTEAGTPWPLVREGIDVLTSQGLTSAFTQFGNITFTNANNTIARYTLDLTEIPFPNTDYRIPGATSDLLTVISQVCQDVAHDYFVELVPLFDGGLRNVIKIRTVSRVQAPPQGVIASFIETQTNAGNSVITSNYGQELRNEDSSTFLIGGQKRSIYQVTNGIPLAGTDPDDANLPADSDYLRDTLVPFYGLDDNGNIYYIKNDGKITVSLASIKLALNEIGDLLPSSVEVDYRVLASVSLGFDGWLQSLEIEEDSELYDVLQTISPDILSSINRAIKHLPQLDHGKIRDTLGFRINSVTKAIWNDLQKLYQFFLSIDRTSREYLMVRIPYTCAKIVDNRLYTTDSPAAGGWTETNQIVGLANPGGVVDYFKNQDGTIGGIAAFSYTGGLDVNGLEGSKYYYEGNTTSGTLYTELAADTDLVFYDRSNAISPRAICKTPDLSQVLIDGAAGFDVDAIKADLNFRFGVIDNDTEKENLRYNSIQLPAEPDAVAVPFVSNEITYGPWRPSNTLGGGRARIEKDDTLVPWTYGGYTNMNTVAQAKADAGNSDMRSGELGSVTIAGAPSVNLGAQIEATGPYLTAMDMSVSTNGGVQTSYSFRTYSHKFGIMSKYNANVLSDRLAKLNRINAERRLTEVAASTSSDLKGLLRSTKRELRKQSRFSKEDETEFAPPGSVIVGEISDGIKDDGSKRSGVAVKSFFNINNDIDNSGYDNKAIMSWDGFMRPVSLSGSGGLPRIAEPKYTGDQIIPTGEDKVLTNRYFNFLANPSGLAFDELSMLHSGSGGHDIEVVARKTVNELRDQYSGTGNSFTPIIGSNIENGELIPDYSDDYRFNAMRGPLWVHGWGYDLEGMPIPNAMDEEDAAASGQFESTGLTDYFMNDWLQKSHTWPLAPIDLRFDRERGVWRFLGEANSGGGGGASFQEAAIVQDLPGAAWIGSTREVPLVKALPITKDDQGVETVDWLDDFIEVRPWTSAKFSLEEPGCVTNDEEPQGISIDSPVSEGRLAPTDNAVLITGTGWIAGATVEVRITDGTNTIGPLTPTRSTGGGWSLTFNPQTLDKGVLSISVTDGSITRWSHVTFPKGDGTSDLERFTGPPDPPDMIESSDLGRSSSDNITSDAIPTFDLSFGGVDGPPDPTGPRAELWVNGTLQYQGTVTDYTTTLTIQGTTSFLSEGIYDAQLLMVLTDGSDFYGPMSSSLTFVVDYSENSTAADASISYSRVGPIENRDGEWILHDLDICRGPQMPDIIADRLAGDAITARATAGGNTVFPNQTVAVSNATIKNESQDPDPSVSVFTQPPNGVYEWETGDTLYASYSGTTWLIGGVE